MFSTMRRPGDDVAKKKRQKIQTNITIMKNQTVIDCVAQTTIYQKYTFRLRLRHNSQTAHTHTLFGPG